LTVSLAGSTETISKAMVFSIDETASVDDAVKCTITFAPTP
jgi:hypothetical protein